MKTEPVIPFSVSFTAGVATACCIRATHAVCIASLAGAFLLLGLSMAVIHGEKALLLGAVFLTGAFSAASRALQSPYFEDVLPLVQGISGTVRSAMDDLTSAIPFADDRTAPLINALLCGDRSGLGRDTVDAFRRSGASHLLALSGLHLGVLATGLGTALEVLGKSRAADYAKRATIIGFSFIYLIACGAGASLQRAFLFITIRQILLGQHSRQLSTAGTLCCALTIQLAADPLSIRSASFQLSYLAMAGITFIFPRLEAFFPDEGRHPGPVRRMWSSMAMSISCQLTTLPVAWLRFHSIPHCFILTNLIALPLCEALVCSAALLAAMSALGWMPAALITVVDTLSRLLLGSIGIISGM